MILYVVDLDDNMHVCQFSYSTKAAVSDPHLSAMDCLNQTVVLFRALSTYCCWGRGLAVCTYPPLWLDARLCSSSPLAARRVIQDLLSSLPAPFSVHAQDKHVTAWRLSGVCLNLIKLEMEFCISLLIYKEARRLELGFFLPSASDAFNHVHPRVAKLRQHICEINAVKVFSSAVCQYTALYAQAGKAGARVQVSQIYTDTAALQERAICANYLCLYGDFFTQLYRNNFQAMCFLIWWEPVLFWRLALVHTEGTQVTHLCSREVAD